MIRFAARVLAAALLTTGCAAEVEPIRAPYIAFGADFDAFRSWERQPVGDDSYVYRSHAPVDGVHAVGTRVVKAIELGPPYTWVIHGMAKRGDGFNAAGAYGWEWFELFLDERLKAVIVWRGEAPPEGAGYGLIDPMVDPGDEPAAGDCNGCHAGADTDFVFTTY